MSTPTTCLYSIPKGSTAPAIPIGIFCLSLSPREDQTDTPPHGGRSRLHQHVYSNDVPVLHPERLNGSPDPVEIVAPNRDIDIPREAPGVGLRFFHVEIHGETADHVVFESGGSELSHPLRRTSSQTHAAPLSALST